jgi:hypothetical protein
METMKDLRDALKDIPDEHLELFGAGVFSEGDGDIVELLYWDEQPEASEMFEKYPQMSKVSNWIKAICKEQVKLEKDDEAPFERDSPISSSEGETK